MYGQCILLLRDTSIALSIVSSTGWFDMGKDIIESGSSLVSSYESVLDLTSLLLAGILHPNPGLCRAPTERSGSLWGLSGAVLSLVGKIWIKLRESGCCERWRRGASVFLSTWPLGKMPWASRASDRSCASFDMLPGVWGVSPLVGDGAPWLLVAGSCWVYPLDARALGLRRHLGYHQAMPPCTPFLSGLFHNKTLDIWGSHLRLRSNKSSSWPWECYVSFVKGMTSWLESPVRQTSSFSCQLWINDLFQTPGCISCGILCLGKLPALLNT